MKEDTVRRTSLNKNFPTSIIPTSPENNRKAIFELSPIKIEDSNFDNCNYNDLSPGKTSKNYLSKTNKTFKEECLNFEDLEQIPIDDKQQKTIFERLMKIEVLLFFLISLMFFYLRIPSIL